MSTPNGDEMEAESVGWVILLRVDRTSENWLICSDSVIS